MDHYFRLTDCGKMFRLSRGPKGDFHSQDKDFKGMLDAPSCPWYFNVGLSNQHLWQHIQAYLANMCK